MGILAIIIPIVIFFTIGLAAMAIFGWLLPTLAGLPHLAWIADAWFQALIKLVFIVLGFVMPLASILTWMERRQSALMQDRLGPNRANINLLGKKITLAGILHFVADALKMLFKEDFVPAKANRALFLVAPLLAIAPVFIVFSIVPFGPTMCAGHLGETMTGAALQQCTASTAAVPFQVAHLDVGLLFYFAIASLSVYGATLAGWASYNKWSLLGGLRASSQMMSYEVTMGLAILGTFLVYGTLEPGAIVGAQTSNPLHWGIVTQPIGFILFFTAAIAETKRTPFDIPEGEPEIIGYFVEYSGLRWGIFFLAEFIEIIFISAIVATVFFGGWQIPGMYANGWHVPWGPMSWFVQMPHWLVISFEITAFLFKVFFLCWFQLMIRWTLPRMRPDQLMNLGWKQLLPVSVANIVVTAIVVLVLLGGK